MRPEEGTNEQAKQSELPAAQSLSERFKEWLENNHDQQPALGAELRAMGREALKDVRGKMMETFFGSQEASMEPGVPLSPTPQMVTNDLGTLGGYQQTLDTYASRGSVHGHAQEREKGIER
jgi:hypothetical protein